MGQCRTLMKLLGVIMVITVYVTPPFLCIYVPFYLEQIFLLTLICLLLLIIKVTVIV